MRVIKKNGEREEMENCRLTVSTIESKAGWEDLLLFMELSGIEAFEDYTLTDVSANPMISREYVKNQIESF